MNPFPRLWGLARRQASAWKNRSKPTPVFGRPTSDGLRVHLGCGQVNIQGWINIDGLAFEHVHLVQENFGLDKFADEGLSEVYLCHVLEHFSFAESIELIGAIRRKLEPGGTIRISVPDFEQIVSIYVESGGDLELVKHPLMGGQDYKYNFHKSVYDQSRLRSIMLLSGFENVTAWETVDDFGLDLGDWSSRAFPTPSGPRRISLNLKAQRAASAD